MANACLLVTALKRFARLIAQSNEQLQTMVRSPDHAKNIRSFRTRFAAAGRSLTDTTTSTEVWVHRAFGSHSKVWSWSLDSSATRIGVAWASHCRRGRVKKKRKCQTLHALGLARPRKEATFFSSMWNVSPDSLSPDSVAKDIRPWDPDPLHMHRQNTQGWASWRVDLQTWGPQGQQLRADGPSSNEKEM